IIGRPAGGSTVRCLVMYARQSLGPRGDRSTPAVGMFATAVPGLGHLLAAEIGRVPGASIRGTGHDGRADLALFWADASTELRLSEDVFVQCGHAIRHEGDRAGWVADRLCHDRPLREAAAAVRRAGRRASEKATVRVVVRVLDERAYRRTDLRRAITQA